MRRTALHCTVALLVVLAGCAGTGPSGAEPTRTGDGTSTASATAGSTTTPSLASPESPTSTAERPTAGEAGERAIAAEKERIRDAFAGCENVTGLGFGILRPSEYEVVERNATAVVVRVEVGYSFSFDSTAVDGAATRTRYRVTEESVRLVGVEQDVYRYDGMACD